jgi:hypothetical protein
MTNQPENLDDSAKHLIGLSKREYFAAIAMQGLCSNPTFGTYDRNDLVDMALEIADTLLLKLTNPNLYHNLRWEKPRSPE